MSEMMQELLGGKDGGAQVGTKDTSNGNERTESVVARARRASL